MDMNRRSFLAISGAPLLAEMTAVGATDPHDKAFRELLETFNPTLPGYGLDHANSLQPMVHDMALALYLVAVAKKGMAVESRRAADQLIALGNKPAAAMPGWGLGFGWVVKGYGDYAATAVLGITNATAVWGLFEAYDLTKETRYRDFALEVLEAYIARCFVRDRGREGFFLYSDQDFEAGKPVSLNVTAMLMGQCARAAKYGGDTALQEAAELSAVYLWQRRQTDPSGVYWAYYDDNDSSKGANDGLHAAYMVQGYIELDRAGFGSPDILARWLGAPISRVIARTSSTLDADVDLELSCSVESDTRRSHTPAEEAFADKSLFPKSQFVDTGRTYAGCVFLYQYQGFCIGCGLTFLPPTGLASNPVDTPHQG